MKVIQFEVETTRGEVTDFAGQTYREISMVVGDVVLIAAKFKEIDIGGTTISPVNLTGSLALRASVGNERQTGTTILAFEDVFNDGDIPAFEDLSTGQVTWLLDLPAAVIEPVLGTNEFIETFLEFTVLNADDTPQTLAQIGLIIYSQIDDGAVGVPPPPTSYMLSSTALATFVLLPDYLNPITISSDTVLVAASVPSGLQVYFIDTSGGPVTLTLPEASAAPAKFAPIIINTGTGIASVTPDATAPDTINAFVGTQTINTQYGTLRLYNDPTSDNWLAPIIVNP